MNIETILKIAYSVIAFLSTVIIPGAITLVRKVKELKAAKTEAEKAKVFNEMLLQAQTFISDAEALYRDVDCMMKQKGGTCGAIKKDGVMTKLQQLAANYGIEFDAEYWSAKVDDLVALTKKVNA